MWRIKYWIGSRLFDIGLLREVIVRYKPKPKVYWIWR